MELWIYKNKKTGNYFNWDHLCKYKHENCHRSGYDITKGDVYNLKDADKFNKKEAIYPHAGYDRILYSEEIKNIRKLKIQQLNAI